jgi:hypothetical protein
MTAMTEATSAAPVEDVRARDKELIFAALAEAGIKTLIVRFDGYGDSGQIENIAGWSKAADDLNNLADADIVPYPSNQTLQLASDPPAETTLQDAIESMVYDFLEETHWGWEDGEGAYGTFVFSIPERAITLQHNERSIDVNTSTHNPPGRVVAPQFGFPLCASLGPSTRRIGVTWLRRSGHSPGRRRTAQLDPNGFFHGEDLGLS